MFTLKNIRNATAKLPTPVGALALTFAGFGLTLENAFPLQGTGQSLGGFTAIILLLALACKFILTPKLLWADLAHPITGSILPTFTMALMIVSQALRAWGQKNGLSCDGLSAALWLTAVILHLTIMTIFILHRLNKKDFIWMAPSWFIPTVGIITAAMTSPGGIYDSVAIPVLVLGMINYALLLPLMLNRLIFKAELPASAQPTIAVLAAPASLALVGYLRLTSNPSLLICAILSGIALLMTAVVYVSFIRLLRLPFTPAYASFTFPLVISSSAMYKVAEMVGSFPLAEQYVAQLRLIALFELTIAGLLVIYVSLRYIFHYGKPLCMLFAKKAPRLEAKSSSVLAEESTCC